MCLDDLTVIIIQQVSTATMQYARSAGNQGSCMFASLKTVAGRLQRYTRASRLLRHALRDLVNSDADIVTLDLGRYLPCPSSV